MGVREHRGPVDGEEGRRRVVDEQEQRDPDGRTDQVPLEDLAPRVGGRRHNSASEMPRAVASTRARSCSVTISWSRSRDERSFIRNRRDEEQDEGHATRDDECHFHPPGQRGCRGSESMVLVATMEVISRAGHRSDGPEAHGRRPAQLRAEVAHQGRRGHQDGPLDQAEGADAMANSHCGGAQWDGHGHQQADDQQPVDDHVGPPELVGLAGRQRGERADEVGDHHDAHIEGERHVVVLQDVGGHPGLGEVGVVEDDGGERRPAPDRRSACPSPGTRRSRGRRGVRNKAPCSEPGPAPPPDVTTAAVSLAMQLPLFVRR